MVRIFIRNILLFHNFHHLPKIKVRVLRPSSPLDVNNCTTTTNYFWHLLPLAKLCLTKPQWRFYSFMCNIWHNLRRSDQNDYFNYLDFFDKIFIKVSFLIRFFHLPLFIHLPSNLVTLQKTICDNNKVNYLISAPEGRPFSAEHFGIGLFHHCNVSMTWGTALHLDDPI